MKQHFCIREILKKFRTGNEKGAVLILSLVVLSVILGSGLLYMTRLNKNLQENAEYRKYQENIFYSKSAIDECRWQLSLDPEYSGTNGHQKGENGSEYQVMIQRISDTERGIIIESIDDIYERQYTGTAEFDPDTGQLMKFSVKLKY